MKGELSELRKEVEWRADRVNDALFKELPFGDGLPLYDAAAHLLEAGGKRIRPVLLLMVTEAFGREPGDYNGVMPSAVAMEIIHSFTLIHDDIMDNDVLRRGVPSVHVKWNDATAILTGDYLYSKAFELALRSDAEPSTLNDVIAMMSETCTRICEGQALDVEMQRMDEVDEEIYLDMVEKKTAVLFATSTGIGATLMETGTETVSELYEYGIKMGKAFQIQDDIIDLISTSDEIGKSRGSDLVEGKRTLISIEAERRGIDIQPPRDATEEEIEQKINEIKDSGCIDYASGYAEELARDSKMHLSGLPDTPAKNMLENIPNLLIERTH